MVDVPFLLLSDVITDKNLATLQHLRLGYLVLVPDVQSLNKTGIVGPG